MVPAVLCSFSVGRTPGGDHVVVVVDDAEYGRIASIIPSSPTALICSAQDRVSRCPAAPFVINPDCRHCLCHLSVSFAGRRHVQWCQRLIQPGSGSFSFFVANLVPRVDAKLCHGAPTAERSAMDPAGHRVAHIKLGEQRPGSIKQHFVNALRPYLVPWRECVFYVSRKRTPPLANVEVLSECPTMIGNTPNPAHFLDLRAASRRAAHRRH